MQKLLGYVVSDTSVQKVASLAQRLFILQPSNLVPGLVCERQTNGSGEDVEFGANLAFQAPSRFLVDASLEGGGFFGEESAIPSLGHGRWSDHTAPMPSHSSVDRRNFTLRWLRDACDGIVRGSTSQLSQDDLAMAICRVLDFDKPGEEVLVTSFSLSYNDFLSTYVSILCILN